MAESKEGRVRQRHEESHGGVDRKASDPTDDVSEDSSNEEVIPKHRTRLSTHSTTSLSLSLDLKTNYSKTITESSQPNFFKLADMKPTQSHETLLSQS